jgi:hypothetical protein
MSIDENSYHDLQEIVFWQSLNRQLNELFDGANSRGNVKHDYLQRFCLEERLFHRITSSKIADEVQLSLATDFQKVRIITFGSVKWCDTLRDLLNNLVTFNIDSALANAFEEMRRLEIDGALVEKMDDDDDPDLFAVIDEYNNLIDKQNRDIGRLVETLFEFKSESMKVIRDQIPDNHLIFRNEILRLDCDDLKNRAQVVELYIETYCIPCIDEIQSLSSAAKVFADMDILNFFDQFDSEKSLKPAIKAFIDHERNLLTNWNNIISSYVENARVIISKRVDCDIQICDLRPFQFLEYPLPLV